MPESTTSLTNRPAWKALQEHYNQIRSRHLRAMFADQLNRPLQVESLGAAVLMAAAGTR